MRCPYCAHEETTVVETRESDEGDAVRRRRRCSACDKRFTTYERAELAMPAVVKKNGDRREFDREKLRASMSLALRKRNVSVDLIDAAISRIEEKLFSSGSSEVTTSRIGELVMRELKRLDKVAYVRFASVYREFEDIDAFSKLIKEIRSGGLDAQPPPTGVTSERTPPRRGVAAAARGQRLARSKTVRHVACLPSPAPPILQVAARSVTRCWKRWSCCC